MVHWCCIKNCKSEWKATKGVTFHSFPVNVELREKVVAAIPPSLRRKVSKYSKICSKHFTTDCFQPVTSTSVRRILKRGAIPTLFDYYELPTNKASNNGSSTSNVIVVLDEDEPADDDLSQSTMRRCDTGNMHAGKRDVSIQTMEQFSNVRKKDVGVQLTDKCLPPSQTVLELRHKIKILQRRLLRRDARLKTVTNVIQHRQKGKGNQTTHALSRVEAINLPIVVTTDELYEEQQKDEELSSLLESRTALSLKQLRLDDGEKTIYCDVADQIRIYVPASLRKKIFDVTHLSHPGVRATKKIIAQRFVWPNMEKDITRWAKTYLACQKSKIHRYNVRSPEQIQVPNDRRRHLDIVEPLPQVRGSRARWPEAVSIRDISTDTVPTAFFKNWVVRFGTPARITTDRGTHFESQVFDALAKMIGSRRIRTTAYHPQSSGIIERWQRSLKTTIKCHNTPNWVDIPPTVLLGLRTSYKDDIKRSATEMAYGATSKLPGEYFAVEDPMECPQMFSGKLRERMLAIAPRPAHHVKRKAFIYRDLEDCTHVFVRVDRPKKPLEQSYEGPFEVIARPSGYLYRVNFKGQPTEINIDRLKPAFIKQEVEEANDPAPGPSKDLLRDTERSKPSIRSRLLIDCESLEGE